MNWRIRQHPVFKDLAVIPNKLLRSSLDLQYRSHRQAERTLLKDIDFNHAHVLDFGSGDQDFSKRNSCKYYESIDPAYSSTWKDLKDIPEGKRFDLIVCSEVLEHIKEPGRILEGLASRQSVGNRLYITTPFLARQHGAPSDYHRWTEQGMITLLESSGYKVERILRRGNLISVLSALMNYKTFRLFSSIYFPLAILLLPLVAVLLSLAHLTLRSGTEGDTYLGLSVLAIKSSSNAL